MRCILCYFRFFDSLWLTVAKQYQQDVLTQSYAIRMAMMYHNLFEAAVARFDPQVVNQL